MARDLLAVLSGLYESEINFSISSFWDEGITVRLGDDMNGVRAEHEFHPKRLDQTAPGWIAQWLHARALEHFPNSQYAATKEAGRLTDEELLKRAAADLEGAAEFVGLEGNFSAAKDYLDTAQRIRELLARRPKDEQ